MADADDSDDRRPKKACTQCRQQKARCSQPAQGPCARCQRLGLECLVVEGFEREHKRRKLYQLESETQQLRNQLIGAPSERNASSISPTHADVERKGSQRPRVATTPIKRQPSAQTLPRMIDGLLLESNEVDQLFHIFFDEYASYLPILDHNTPPNYYYQASTSLFWAVVAIASRNYEIRPELRRIMASKVVDLALLAMRARVSIRSIQALLLLLTWTLARETGELDPTFLLNGTLLHMSIQLGLHAPLFSQEFSKDRLDLTTEELSARASLWARCVLTYQRSCVTKGSPGMALSDITLDPDQRDRLLAIVPGDLRFQVKAQDVLVRCSSILANNGLQNISQEQERGMEMTITAFLSQLDEFKGPTALSTESEYANNVSQLVMHCFYFYLDPERWLHRANIISSLVASASRVISICASTDTGSSTSRPWYYLHGLLHASTAMLRLYKTPSTSSLVDRNRTKALVQSAANALRAMTLDSKDLPARAANILEQLCASSRVFVHPSSSPGQPQAVPLRIRSRLAMSHVLDVWVWWREEFGGYAGVYPTPLKELESNTPNADQEKTQPTPNYTLRPANGSPSQPTPLPEPSNSVHTMPSTYFNPSQPLGVPMDPLPEGLPDSWLQDDIFADVWTWPNEDWGLPSLT